MRSNTHSRGAPSRPSYAGTTPGNYIQAQSSSDAAGGGPGCHQDRARIQHSSLRGDDLRRSDPKLLRRPTPDCFSRFAPRNDERKAERRKALFNNHRILRCGARPCGARSPLGVPPRHLRSATERHRSARATRLPRTGSERAAPMVRKIARIATHFYAKPADRPSLASLAGVTRALLSQSSEIAPAVRS